MGKHKDMIEIDLQRLAREKRTTIRQVALECDIVYNTLLRASVQGRIHPKSILKLEKVYSDIASYIK